MRQRFNDPTLLRRTGAFVKSRREMLSLSRKELAKALKYSDMTSIIRIENGSVPVPQHRLLEVAAVLRVDSWQFAKFLSGEIKSMDVNLPTGLKQRARRKPDYSSLGVFIQARREKLGLPKKQISRQLGYTNNQVMISIEAGTLDPRVSTLAALADVLGLDRLELLGRALDAPLDHSTGLPRPLRDRADRTLTAFEDTLIRKLRCLSEAYQWRVMDEIEEYTVLQRHPTKSRRIQKPAER